jgi:penicillin-binding protein 1A
MAFADEVDAVPAASGHGWRRATRAFAVALLLGLLALIGAAWTLSPSTSGVLSRVRGDARDGAREVPLGEIAPQLRKAVVDTEDERFFRHHGIDAIGILRAAAYDVSHLTFSQGASTITEQLAKDLYLDGNDHSVWRKLEDAAMALRIESQLSKEQILAAYLDTAYFGHGAYGIGQAARRYFGTAPERLTLAQATLLAGLVQAPSADDPFTNPMAGRLRQVDVLVSMIRNHDITAGEGARVLGRPLSLAGGPTLPALRGVDLSPGQAFSGWQMATGLAFLIGGALALFVLGRRSRSLWRAGPALATVAGVLLIARALHGD